MKATPARDVAKTTLSMLDGKHLVSDNPTLERFWMNKLLNTAKASSPMLFNYEVIAASACQNNPFALDHLYEKLQRITAPHRAGPDAVRLAKGVLRGLQFVRTDENSTDGSSDEQNGLASLQEAEIKLLY